MLDIHDITYIRKYIKNQSNLFTNFLFPKKINTSNKSSTMSPNDFSIAAYMRRKEISKYQI